MVFLTDELEWLLLKAEISDIFGTKFDGSETLQ